MFSFSYRMVSALTAAFATLATAQPVHKVSDGNCRCRIRIDTVAHLGTDSEPGAIAGDLVYGVRDSRGRYYLTQPYSTQVLVFGPQGNFLRTFGQKGKGPGEFGGIAKVLPGPGDSLYILDSNNARLTVFSPSYTYVRSVAIGVMPEVEAVRLSSGDIVLNMSMPTPGSIGQPLHYIRATTGELAKSFGSRTGVFRPDIPHLGYRVLAPSTHGRIWSGTVPKYAIDLVDPVSGTILESIERDVSWFPSSLRPHTAAERASMEPKPLLANLQEDGKGLLWVVLMVPDKRWKEAVSPPKPGENHGRVTDELLYYDTVIEVIDLNKRQHLASIRMDDPRLTFVGDGLVGTIVENAKGQPRFRVLKLQLQRP